MPRTFSLSRGEIMKRLGLLVTSAIFLVGMAGRTTAATIPYPNPGVLNPASYAFTAANTGDIIGYYAGSSAAYTEVIGLLVNGVQTPAGFGLNNHASFLGQAFNFGPVTKGDSLVFNLYVYNLGNTGYSD